MDNVVNILRLLSLVCVMALTGCSNTQTPAYPAQLQMIIAQSATTADAPVQQNAPQAISVEQLLANVKATQNKSVKANQNATGVQQRGLSGEQKMIHGRDSVPDWIFKGESRRQQNVVVGPQDANDTNDALARAQALIQTQTHQASRVKPLLNRPEAFATAKQTATAKSSANTELLQAVLPNQRQLQLQYKANELLPHQMQLLMAKQMVAIQQMRLVKLVIGTSNESSSFAQAATASRRAKLLIEQVSEQQSPQHGGIVVEYLPKIGDNIAIVTFQPRGR